MTTPWTNAALPDPEMDRLGDAWDALVAGRRGDAPEADAELVAVVGQLTAEATPIRPTLTFRNSLRETLMHAETLSLPAAPSAPTFHPLPKLGRPVEVTSPAATLPGRIRRAGMRWAAIAATVALVLTTSAGGFLATRGPGDGGRATSVAGFQASPEAVNDYVDPCPRQPYYPCGATPQIGQALVVGTLFPPEATAGTNVTMLGWTVHNGETVTFDPADTQIVPGVAIDIVVDGAYSATFSGPAVIQRGTPLGTSIEYPTAGDAVELGQGDSVSFAQGTRVEVTNLNTTRPLIFKSIVIHDIPEADTGVPGSGQSVEGNPMGGAATYQVDGMGTIPMSISQYPRQEFGVFLTYSQVIPDVPVPANVGDSAVIMGPVAPTDFVFPELTPEEGTEGYFVWLYISKG